jgi:hypothetical protein
MKDNKIIGLIPVLFLSACVYIGQYSTVVPSTAEQSTATGFGKADSVFTGCARLDANDNGTIDDGDTLMGGLVFVIKANTWKHYSFGANTVEGECAVVLVPGPFSEAQWPIAVKIFPADDNFEYDPVTPTEVLLPYRETRANFLFRRREN